ncbi:MAG: hypothetical protein DIU71_13830, partial [Proteobacteria bacterium]
MAALGAAWPGASAARDCAGRDAAALQLDRTLSLAARDTQHLDISLGTAGEHLVLVIEDGIDVVAWVAAEPGIRPTPADAALARRGVQRFVVTVAEPTRLRLTVRGKEHAHARGRVRILHRPLDRGCAALLRVLSEAQAAYARAELVTRGLDPGATDDVPAEYRRAGDKLAEAAARAQSQAPESTASRAALQGEILLELAIARYVEGGRWAESADAAARAMSALQAAGDRYGEASALTRRAIALMEVARAGRAPYSPEAVRLQREARALLSRAIDLHAAHGERYEQALAQNNLGLSLFYEGRIPEALAAYQAALRLHEQLDEPPRRAQVLQNIALARLDLGQFSEAVHEYDQVLELLDAAAQPVLYASVLNNSALANAVAGNIDTALDRYSAALEIWIGLQNVREQARSRNGLGYVYYLAGDYDLAFEFYEQALALRTVELDPAGRASTLRTLGNLNRMLGRVERALALHREAFTLATTPIARNSALIQIARDFAAEGNHDRAIGLLDAVLAGDGVDVLTVAHARLDLGRSLAARGNRRAAVVELEAALALFRDHHLLAEEIECLIELARLGRAAGALDHALDLLDQAMVAADGLRMHSANPEMQASLTRPGRRAADLMIDLLLETGATPLGALSVAERARARVLAEIDAARDRPRAGGSTHAQRRESLY